MRVMAIMKATTRSEAGDIPSQQVLESMGQYNEELVKAGVMLAGEGLRDSARGVRINFGSDRPAIVNGPFAPAGELAAGFWLWQVRSMDEAVEWAKRCPNPEADAFTIELRQVFEADDFGTEFTPELREQEDRLREQLAGRT